MAARVEGGGVAAVGAQVAFEAADGGAVALPDGEFVDLPVARRAERLLARA